MEYSRRAFFGQFSRSLAHNAMSAVGALRSELAWCILPNAKKPQERRWLRPPGALPEAQFLSSCTRCTACQESCPYQSIRRLGTEYGSAEGTPAIIPGESPCYLCEDMPCIAACEPQALAPTPRVFVSMGAAVIDESACYAALGQPCDYCVVKCPIGRDAIRFDGPGCPVVAEIGCTGCGVCAFLCPAQAVTMIPCSGS